MPMTCFYELPEAGQEAIVFTTLWCVKTRNCCTVLTINKSHVVQRVDQNQRRRPEVGAGDLSGMSAQQFVNAVEREEVGD